MSKLDQIAGDLDALLGSSKVKEIVVQEDKTEQNILTEETNIAPALVAAVFKNLQEGYTPADVGKSLVSLSRYHAEENNLSSFQLNAAILEYCLTIAETINEELAS